MNSPETWLPADHFWMRRFWDFQEYQRIDQISSGIVHIQNMFMYIANIYHWKDRFLLEYGARYLIYEKNGEEIQNRTKRLSRPWEEFFQLEFLHEEKSSNSSDDVS